MANVVSFGQRESGKLKVFSYKRPGQGTVNAWSGEHSYSKKHAFFWDTSIWRRCPELSSIRMDNDSSKRRNTLNPTASTVNAVGIDAPLRLAHHNLGQYQSQPWIGWAEIHTLYGTVLIRKEEKENRKYKKMKKEEKKGKDKVVKRRLEKDVLYDTPLTT